MIRTFLICLSLATILVAACQKNEQKQEVLDIPDQIVLGFEEVDLTQVKDGGKKLMLSVSSGPEVFVDNYLIENLAFDSRYNSLTLGSITLSPDTGGTLAGLDSVEINIRPTNRDDYLPLAYLANPVDSANAGGPISLQGFEVADFVSAFPNGLFGELRVELFFSDATDISLPKDMSLEMLWKLDLSYKTPK
ncbi:MAG: hypothetical protein AB8F95_11560 [Bacteroidia bacterium]